MEKEKIVLEGVLSTVCNCGSYPGRIYGKYECINGKWIMVKDWYKKNNLFTKEIEKYKETHNIK